MKGIQTKFPILGNHERKYDAERVLSEVKLRDEMGQSLTHGIYGKKVSSYVDNLIQGEGVLPKPYFGEFSLQDTLKVVPQLAPQYVGMDDEVKENNVHFDLPENRKRKKRNLSKKRSKHTKELVPRLIYGSNPLLKHYIIVSGDSSRNRVTGEKEFRCYIDGHPEICMLLRELKLKIVHPRQSSYVQHLNQIEHPHIEKYHDIVHINKLVYTIRKEFQSNWLIMDSYLSNRSRTILSDKTLLDMLIQIGEALKYLHQQNIIHGNLTINHLLVNGADGKPHIRLIDYSPVQCKDIEIAKINDLFSFSTLGSELMKGISAVDRKYSKFYHEVLFILAKLTELKKQRKRLNYGVEINIDNILEQLHSLYYKTTRSVHRNLRDKTIFRMFEKEKETKEQIRSLAQKQDELKKKFPKKIHRQQSKTILPEIHIASTNTSAKNTPGSNSSSGRATPSIFWRSNVDLKKLTHYRREEEASNTLVKVSEHVQKHSPAERFLIENDVFIEHVDDVNEVEDYDVFNAIAKIKRVRESEYAVENAPRSVSEEAIYDFLESKKNHENVLLLKGSIRSGRKTFCLSLEQNLWKQHDSMRYPIVPILINLSNCNPPYDDIVDQYFLRHLTQQELDLLKSTKLVTFCFIFDGYENVQQPKILDSQGYSEYNLYNLNDLSAWNCRTIITVTPDCIKGFGKKYRIYFSPNCKANRLVELDMLQTKPKRKKRLKNPRNSSLRKQTPKSAEQNPCETQKSPRSKTRRLSQKSKDNSPRESNKKKPKLASIDTLIKQISSSKDSPEVGILGRYDFM